MGEGGPKKKKKKKKNDRQLNSKLSKKFKQALHK